MIKRCSFNQVSFHFMGSNRSYNPCRYCKERKRRSSELFRNDDDHSPLIPSLVGFALGCSRIWLDIPFCSFMRTRPLKRTQVKRILTTFFADANLCRATQEQTRKGKTKKGKNRLEHTCRDKNKNRIKNNEKRMRIIPKKKSNEKT